ncbi:OsmC family protein [Methanoculleus sp. FWC-SCC1]|uniref:OsmC family protein n=1 Tax=Methanoculleus frigidifontis TaxID=2584085 RepID=A0ABT8MD67_9EURY|nr:OsmC family protein [Methanoculleus sp. FWC-SCC1]MDN7025888.1 OsmC family protein [Methanoculleus sp. FWC-SCC1]
MMVNGIDMEKVAATVSRLEADPRKGRLTLKGITDWNGGAHSTGIFRNFVIAADESGGVGGTNRGPGPSELVLAALGACITVAIAYSAAEEGIDLRSVELDVEGDIDLAGFFRRDLSTDAGPGFSAVRVTARVDADAEPERIAAIVQRGQERSAVLDTLSHPVPVMVRLEQEVPADR